MTTHTWAQASAWAHNLSVLETSGHTRARQSKQDKRSWGSSGVLNLGVNGRKMPTTSLRTLRPMIWVVFIYLYPPSFLARELAPISLRHSLSRTRNPNSCLLQCPYTYALPDSATIESRIIFVSCLESSSYRVWGSIRHRYDLRIRHRYDLRITNDDTLIRKY